MSALTDSNTVRWTPSRIRKALRFPKPQGARAKVGGDILPRSAPEQELVRWIASHADLLDVPAPEDEVAPLRNRPAAWLLVPAPRWLIDGLATFEAALVDCEPSSDAEPDTDAEPDDLLEPSEVRPNTMSRVGMVEDGPDLVVSPAQRDRYRQSSPRAALRDVKRQLRVEAPR